MNIRLHLALNSEVKTVWMLTSAPPYVLIETYFQSPCSGLILWISHDSETVLFLLYLNMEGNLLASKWRYRLYLPRVVGIFLIFVVWGRYLEVTTSSSTPVLILSQYRIMFLFFFRMKIFVYCTVYNKIFKYIRYLLVLACSFIKDRTIMLVACLITYELLLVRALDNQ
jgi:hypothetical protein